jgi:hypothetical protein
VSIYKSRTTPDHGLEARFFNTLVMGKLHRVSHPAADPEKAQCLRLTLPAEGSGVNCIPFLVEFGGHFKL